MRNVFADRVGDIYRRVLDGLGCLLDAVLGRARTLRRFVGEILRAMFDGMGTLRYSTLRSVCTLQKVVTDGARNALGRILDHSSGMLRCALDSVHA
jgi:hypothetical protein